MTDRDTLILHVLNLEPPHGGEEFITVIVAYCMALGYLSGMRPEVIATVALGNVIGVFRETMSDADWTARQTEMANLLEQQAHKDAA